METRDPNYHNPPEIWGGLECTINRVQDTYRDQLMYAGHYDRDDDVAKIAALGIQKLRYPILWEAHQKNSAEDVIDWTHSEKKIRAIKDHGMEPIIGLVHHGSGPSFTSLSDRRFGKMLSEYASKVATKFPFLKYYTPVNEPLTTARFSGLYGHWYPHKKSGKDFCRMLVNQLKGVVLSMQAIRKINPEAELIQTEDLSFIHSSKSLKYQAVFENRRRWLTYDFLCGKFTAAHPLWNYFLSEGISENELNFFLENPCAPSVAGFNYYVTSERYLDEITDRWPGHSIGGNDKHAYADVAAVRACKPKGLSFLLTEAWKRYQLPVALTEVHLNCTREEQLRWFHKAFNTAVTMRKNGIPVVAVTAWALLGAYDWNSLLTREEKAYEPGAFDNSQHQPRPTAIAGLVRDLAHTKKSEHPLLAQQGWWQYAFRRTKGHERAKTCVLVLGVNGTLGTAFKNICQRRNIPIVGLARPAFNITRQDDLEKAIDQFKPWAIINTIGYVKVDEAEKDRELCHVLNAVVVAQLAKSCNDHGIQLMTFSSDLVFNGEKISPYLEADVVAPLNHYGHCKAEGERWALDHFQQSLVIRTSSFFGPWDTYNFAHNLLKTLQAGDSFCAVEDVIVSPTYVPHLVDNALDLMIDRETGVWHLCNDGRISWSDFAIALADRVGVSKKNILVRKQLEMNWQAKRPFYSALGSEKGVRLPSLECGIESFIAEKCNV